MCLSLISDGISEELPFKPGEKLVFELKWSFIKAGEAVMEVLPMAALNGSEVYHFVVTAETVPALDLIYKVRDRIDAYTDSDISRSVLYRKKQQEGRSIRDITVTFDWDRKEAQYVNFSEVVKPIAIMEGTFDPLSAFYYTRKLEIRENSIIERPITDGKKNVIGQVRVVRKEQIRIREKKYDTYLIEPELKGIGGVFEKSRNAKIQVWITADERKIPVRVKSKVVVGSFVAELLSADGLK